jgi:hypothetical protein
MYKYAPLMTAPFEDLVCESTPPTMVAPLPLPEQLPHTGAAPVPLDIKQDPLATADITPKALLPEA